MNSPTRQPDQAALLDELAEHFLAAARRGESVSAESYAAQHPEMASEILELFPTLLQLEGLKGDRPAESNTPTIAKAPELSGYRISREIARGGMGVVYEAQQLSLNRTVALKVLSGGSEDDHIARERFRNEAQAAARLHHTNIVPVYEVGSEGDTHFYAMQYIDGKGLNHVIQEVRQLLDTNNVARQSESKNEDADHDSQSCDTMDASAIAVTLVGRSTDLTPRVLDDAPNKPVDDTAPVATFDQSTMIESGGSVSRGFRRYCDRVAQLGVDAANAIAYAHSFGIIHRDIKPANLLLDRQGTIWVADFGLAKAENVELTQTGAVVGTLRYMAPERFDGQADAQGDVYALGMTLYEMLAREPGFQSSNPLSLLEKIRSEAPAPLGKVDGRIPRNLQTIIHKAIAQDPRHRYRSADALSAELQRYLSGQPILARRASLSERFGIWVRRSPMVAGLTLLLVGGALLTAVAAVVVALNFRDLADRNAELLVDAQFSEAEARRVGQRATEAAERADNQAKINRQRLYFAEMRQAGETSRSPSGYRGVELRLKEWDTANDVIRGWEYDWLKALTNSYDELARGKRLRSAIYAPSLHAILWAENNRITIRDIATGETREIRRGVPGGTDSIGINSAGNLLAASSRMAKSVVVLNLETGDVVKQFKAPGECGKICWHSENNVVAFVAWTDNTQDGPRNLFVWDLDANTEQKVSDPNLHMNALDFSPDGAWLANGVKTGGMRLFNTETWEPRVIPSKDVPIAVKWHPDGSVIAAVSPLHTQFWTPAGNKRLTVAQPPVEAQQHGAWHPQGKYFATIGHSQGVHVWGWPDGKRIRQLGD